MAYAVKLENGLNEKENTFCMFYIQNGYNGTQAAISAGYMPLHAKKTAWKILQRPHVKQFIAQHQATLLSQKEKEIDDSFIYKRNQLRTLADQYLNACEDGRLVPPDYARVAIDAIKELNKMEGHLAAEKRVNLNLKADVDLQRVLEILPTHEKEY